MIAFIKVVERNVGVKVITETSKSETTRIYGTELLDCGQASKIGQVRPGESEKKAHCLTGCCIYLNIKDISLNHEH